MYREFVTRENINGVWISTYYNTMKEAKTLMMKIIRKGGAAIALRAAR